MGRRGESKRLAIPGFKMADQTHGVTAEKFSRPFHDAFRAKRTVCPEEICMAKRLFFEKSGLDQHYRVVHKKEATPTVMKFASQTMRHYYGEETLAFICYLSERKSEVSI